VERELSLAGLQVDGVLPPTCAGLFLRNGPNCVHEPLGGQHHLFDGPGMLHWLRLRPEDNSAEYGNAWVRTQSFEAERAAGRRLHVSLSQPPQAGPMLRGLAAKLARADSPYWVVQSANSANNGVQFHAGRLLATYEAGSAYELELRPGLRSARPCSFGGSWGLLQSWTENFSAHSKVCPETGELVWIGYNLVPLGGPPTVTVGVVAPDGVIAHTATLPVSRPSLQHDVGITRSRTVLLDGPLVFNLQRSLEGGLPFDFLREQPMKVGLLPRFGSAADVVWCSLPPSFAYHVANCWDDPGHPDRVVVLLARMAETRALGLALASGGIPPSEPFRELAQLWRYTLCARTGDVLESRAAASAEDAADYPAVFPGVRGQPSRYVFAAGERAGDDAITSFDSLLRVDLQSGEVARRRLPPGVLCGDFQLVPSSPELGCEQGHVLLLTHVLAEDRTELLVLRADDVEGPPAATVRVPARVPFGFHTGFVPQSALADAWP